MKAAESPKFHKKWTGPYLVVSRSDDGLLYRLRHCTSGKEPRAAVHANRLKPYQDNRDTFFLRHNIKPCQIDHPVPAVPADNALPDDTWFPIETLLSHKKVGKKVFYLV